MDDYRRKPTGGVSALPNAPVARDPRTKVVVPIHLRYASIIDFSETQSVNMSRSGMFISTGETLEVGVVLDFEVTLADGYRLFRGKAEVARISASPRGVGVRFQQLDEASRALIDRIVEVNVREGRNPTVPVGLVEPPAVTPSAGLRGATVVSSGGVVFKDRTLRISLTPTTVSYFVYNPLLNIRLGGFVVPCEDEVPLGTGYAIVILDFVGKTLFDGNGKVVAKHETRLGIRLLDVDKGVLAMLQAEVAKLAPK